jgi:tight adherence protein B
MLRQPMELGVLAGPVLGSLPWLFLQRKRLQRLKLWSANSPKRWT